MLATEDWKKIFSRHSKSSVTSTEIHFLKVPKWSETLLPLRGVSKFKNHRHLTFEIIESVRDVVWHSRLFLRIAMILWVLASTHVGYRRLKEKFLTTLKVNRDVQWNPFFEGPKMVWGTFAFDGVSKLKNHRHLTFDIIESVRGFVWHPRLFLRIAMILWLLASTHVDASCAVILAWKAQKMNFCCILWILVLMKPKTQDMNQRAYNLW